MDHAHHHHAADSSSTTGDVAIDPVCGMSVKTASSKFKTEHGGVIYYFCSRGCHDKFVANPAAYLKSPEPHKRASPAGTPKSVEARPASVGWAPLGVAVEYTCPMHPEIIRATPGDC